MTIAGDTVAPDFTAMVRRDGVVVAGMTVNQPRAIPELRREIEMTAHHEEAIEDEIRTAG